MTEPLLRIENDGPLVANTNFWSTAAAKAGKFFLSINAGAFRLLVPSQHQGALREMRSAHTVVVSRGPWPAQRLADALELLFDDGSEDPFSLHLSPEACDRLLPDTDSAREWTCSVWVHLVGERCRQALTKPAYYRRVRHLPDLRPWVG
jgi:hypothetical protein